MLEKTGIFGATKPVYGGRHVSISAVALPPTALTTVELRLPPGRLVTERTRVQTTLAVPNDGEFRVAVGPLEWKLKGQVLTSSLPDQQFNRAVPR